MTGSLWRIRLLMYQEYICQWSPCASAHVCFCKCQNKETVQWIFSFQYAASTPVLQVNADHWNVQGRAEGARRTLTNTHAPARWASVAVDSEGLVYRGFEPERPPCTRTCRQDLRPCCTPASLPRSRGTVPATQTSPVLMKSLRGNTWAEERLSKEKHTHTQKKSVVVLFVWLVLSQLFVLRPKYTV